MVVDALSYYPWFYGLGIACPMCVQGVDLHLADPSNPMILFTLKEFLYNGVQPVLKSGGDSKRQFYSYISNHIIKRCFLSVFDFSMLTTEYYLIVGHLLMLLYAYFRHSAWGGWGLIESVSMFLLSIV